MPFTQGDIIQLDRNATVWPFDPDDSIPIKWGSHTRLNDWTLAIVTHSPPPPESYAYGATIFAGSQDTFNKHYSTVVTVDGQRFLVRNCDASQKSKMITR